MSEFWRWQFAYSAATIGCTLFVGGWYWCGLRAHGELYGWSWALHHEKYSMLPPWTEQERQEAVEEWRSMCRFGPFALLAAMLTRHNNGVNGRYRKVGS